MNTTYPKYILLGDSGGFTLIELLVVVLIVGVLAAIAFPQYQMAVAKSRMAEAISTLHSITEAQELYYLSNGKYTDDLTDLDVEVKETAQWRFLCKNQRTCQAITKKSGTPNMLEFHMLHVPLPYPSSYSGKKWCIAMADNPLGIKVCKSYGPVDPDMTGIYYLMRL